MRHFSRHANTLTQRGMQLNRLTNVRRVCTHFDRKCDLTNHVARMRADHAAAEDFAVAVGFWAVVKQQLGHAFAAASPSRIPIAILYSAPVNLEHQELQVPNDTTTRHTLLHQC